MENTYNPYGDDGSAPMDIDIKTVIYLHNY